MAYCERLTEQLALVAQIDPADYTAGAATDTDIFSMELRRRALFILQTGATVQGPGMLVQIREGATAVMNVTANTAAILTRAAVDCAATDSQYLFEVTAEALQAGYTYLSGRVTPAAGNTLISMTVLADVVRYHPATDNDLPSMLAIQVAN